MLLSMAYNHKMALSNANERAQVTNIDDKKKYKTIAQS